MENRDCLKSASHEYIKSRTQFPLTISLQIFPKRKLHTPDDVYRTEEVPAAWCNRQLSSLLFYRVLKLRSAVNIGKWPLYPVRTIFKELFR